MPKKAFVLKNQSQLEHYASRCLQLIKENKDSYINNYLNYDEKKLALVKEQLYAFGIKDKTILIGIHPTYSGFNKNKRKKEHKHRIWKEALFGLLSKKISQYAKDNHLDIKVIMDLLPEDLAASKGILKEAGGDVILLSNKPDFKRYLAYLHRLETLVVANTGVMHLAAGLNTLVVALFSKSNPNDCDLKWTPYLRQWYKVEIVTNARFQMARKSFTSEFKAKVAIEALKGHRTTNELASEFDIHPTQVNTWKKQLLEGGKAAFSRKQKIDAQASEVERDRLYAHIGKLQVELDWLKKKTGHLC